LRQSHCFTSIVVLPTKISDTMTAIGFGALHNHTTQWVESRAKSPKLKKSYLWNRKYCGIFWNIGIFFDFFFGIIWYTNWDFWNSFASFNPLCSLYSVCGLLFSNDARNLQRIVHSGLLPTKWNDYNSSKKNQNMNDYFIKMFQRNVNIKSSVLSTKNSLWKNYN
jgi:hypothetical protein